MSYRVDFTEQIDDFRAADEGEDVRDSLIDIAEAVQDAVNGIDAELEGGYLYELDATLQTPGKGADAKATGDAVKTICKVIGNPQIEFTDNYYITTNTTVIDRTNTVYDDRYRCAVVSCAIGDVFELNVIGGAAQRAYAVIDTYGNRLAVSNTSASLSNYKLIISNENAAYLIVNDQKSGQVSYKGKAVVDKVTDLQNQMFNLAYMEEECDYVNGAYVITNVNVGETVDISSPVTNNNYAYTIVKCRKNDVFVVSGHGANNPRLWCFTNDNFVLMSKSDIDASEQDLTLYADSDGYFISNTTINASHSTIHKYYFEDAGYKINTLSQKVGKLEHDCNYVNISDPYMLSWIFGYISSSGNLYSNNNGIVMYGPINVVSGYIKPDDSGLVEMQSRFVDDGGATYKTYSSNGINILHEGKLRVGFRYTDTTKKCNDISILDHVEVNLTIKIADYVPVNYKIPNVTYNFVPVSDYVGKHIDATGFKQGTSYAESLAAWRLLPSLSNGYITETELGQIYADGPVVYKYTLTPAYQGRSGAKLPHVFIVTSMHGHEKSSTYGLYYLIRDMIEHYAESEVLSYLRNYVKFTIIPMANPYGWDNNVRQNENGVNLNRNFATSAWSSFDNDPDYTTPGAYNYRGAAPFSEIETQFIRDAIIAEQNDISVIIDCHTNGLNTHTVAEITTPMMNSKNTDIEAVKAAAIGADQYLSSIKSHMDSLYSTDLGNVVYGTFLVYDKSDELNIEMKDWGHESVRCISTILEVLCGTDQNSEYAGYLGDLLYKYSPNVIKLCGEMIGNYIAKILYMLNKTQV